MSPADRFAFGVVAVMQLGALALGIRACWDAATAWPFRRELPRTASEIHEDASEDDFLADYHYCLKARMSRAEFDAYARGLQLTPHTPQRVYDDEPELWLTLSCPSRSSESWWDPSDNLDGVLVEQRGDAWVVAKYERGYAYLSATCH